ncbi:hypothetical protein GGX14DRAFT_628926 [Mycena pura]|uniref:Major facilitator superfamily (MFS) profile domain-containing protein n=1 Tax=Mycena pura TaxID=153505 RepID=A0AAD6YRT7_9AGAR|nr:hypothetical protein GGX14DRAFT_628926 [Mycena pura]
MLFSNVPFFKAGLVKNRRIFLMAVFASLGGLLYGYNQGVFSGVLSMRSFDNRMGDAVVNTGKKGWLVAIFELGAWLGVLLTGGSQDSRLPNIMQPYSNRLGYFADKISRKYTITLAVVVFCIGVIVQTTAKGPSNILGGRFVTGLGVGSMSMAVPLYNSEISPPEAITFGIMVSFWIDFGTNFIGGSGETQSEAAWQVPLALQIVPALILGVGILYMPFSPRWLVNQGRDDEARAVLAYTRGVPEDTELVQIEFLEIKGQYLFEKEVSEKRFPQYQDGHFLSNVKLGFYAYLSLFQERSLLYRVAVGTLTMFFQQWTGINAILYYAPTIFQELGQVGNTNSLLATGVVGIAMFLATIPAVIWVDQLGRRPVLISGSDSFPCSCHFVVAILTGLFHKSWHEHKAAGWVASAFVWIFAMGFGYSWGPCAWIIIAEIWPLSVRGKGVSIAASSNWMNNFIVGEVTPTMLQHLGFGTFVFFGAFSLLGGLFIMFFVPETKGVTLEEMEEVFGSTTGIAMEEQAHMDEIHRRLGLIQDLPQDTKRDAEAASSEDRASASEENEKKSTN